LWALCVWTWYHVHSKEAIFIGHWLSPRKP
jgi:hypothetical protein